MVNRALDWWRARSENFHRNFFFLQTSTFIDRYMIIFSFDWIFLYIFWPCNVFSLLSSSPCVINLKKLKVSYMNIHNLLSTKVITKNNGQLNFVQQPPNYYLILPWVKTVLPSVHQQLPGLWRSSGTQTGRRGVGYRLSQLQVSQFFTVSLHHFFLQYLLQVSVAVHGIWRRVLGMRRMCRYQLS